MEVFGNAQPAELTHILQVWQTHTHTHTQRQWPRHGNEAMFALLVTESWVEAVVAEAHLISFVPIVQANIPLFTIIFSI